MYNLYKLCKLLSFWFALWLENISFLLICIEIENKLNFEKIKVQFNWNYWNRKFSFRFSQLKGIYASSRLNLLVFVTHHLSCLYKCYTVRFSMCDKSVKDDFLQTWQMDFGVVIFNRNSYNVSVGVERYVTFIKT